MLVGDPRVSAMHCLRFRRTKEGNEKAAKNRKRDKWEEEGEEEMGEVK
jgi:hypothetical protein